MFNARAQAAWTDCMEFYQETIKLLDRAVYPLTWKMHRVFLALRVTSANQETCRNGFIDFGIPLDHKIWPFSDDIVSEAVCNALVVNDGAMAVASTPASTLFSSLEMNFPEWISSADRRSLQSWSNMEKADLVVAKDGYGNFTTISDALEASLKLRQNNTSWLVIYVKAGVYNESVEVTDSMKNLMIIGDGIDKTVVTASKNAHDGWTTSTSTTFGICCQCLTFLRCMKIPPQFVVNRWQKDSNLRRSLPCSSSDIVASGPVGRYDSLYKHCIKFAELGAVSEDLYDSALKIISEATEELISSDYTAGDVFPRISSTMNRRSMVNEVDDIHDLGQVRRKGQPPKKRKESLVINLQQAHTRETPPGPWAG